MASSTRKASRAPSRTLTQFARAKRRVGCPVCALPADVRAQLAGASSRKIPRAVQIDWLTTELSVKITDAHLTAHFGGRHDVQDD